MQQDDGAYQTSDMTFATVLIMNGYNPIMRNGTEDKKVVWTISADEWDEGVDHLVEDYLSGACLVEARRFTREFADVRKRLYEFLEISDKPRGARIRRVPSD